MEALRKCSAVPNFVHIFNKLHADYLSLPELDIAEYENSLLPVELLTDDLHDPQILPNIVIKLLKGCGQAYVREDTCLDILRTLAIRKWNSFAQSGVVCPFIVSAREPDADNTVPKTSEVPMLLEFSVLPADMKAETMLVLLNCWMMGHLVKMNFIDKIDPNDLRVVPIGQDQKGHKYFYMCGTRLYKESNVVYDYEKGSGTFEWELLATDINGFNAVAADLRKLGNTGKTRSLVSELKKKIIPALPEIFERNHELYLERRAELRRRRAVVLQAAKEAARLEQQEITAARKRARMLEKDAASSEKKVLTAAQRAERYKRRSQIFGDDSGSSGSTVHKKAFSSERRKSNLSREQLVEDAKRLLMEIFARPIVVWPEINGTD